MTVLRLSIGLPHRARRSEENMTPATILFTNLKICKFGWWDGSQIKALVPKPDNLSLMPESSCDKERANSQELYTYTQRHTCPPTQRN